MLVMGKWKGNDPLIIPANQAHAMGTFKRLSNYTLLEINEKLKTYDKFIVVRHPFERLLSAYRNKFEHKNEYFQSRFGKRIIKVRVNVEKSLTKDLQLMILNFCFRNLDQMQQKNL